LNSRIVFVVDIRGHAFDFVAKSIKFPGEITILYWSDYSTAKKFTQQLESLQPNLVHFFWRKQLEQVFQELQNRAKNYSNLKMSHFTFSVPDHLYISNSELIESLDTFRNSSAYIVTSQKLLQIYKKKIFLPEPYGVVHDNSIQTWPNLSKRRNEKVLRVLWVGNSKWGEWIGKIDYKGLFSVVIPGLKMANKDKLIANLEIIDSSSKKLSHHEVLERMANADVILQSSESEGTGLPLLEATLHGAVPISTDVGIAKEFIPSNLQDFLIVPRNPNALAERLTHLYNNREFLDSIRELCYQAANNFVLMNSNEWTDFIRDTIKRPVESRFLEREIKQFRRLWRFLREFALNQRARKFGKALIRKIPSLKPKLIKFYLYLQRPTIRKFNVKANSKVDVLAIYNPKWSGVSNSTQNIFENTFPIPHSTAIDSDYFSNELLDSYTEFMIGCVGSKLYISGGDFVHISLAKRLKSLRPNLEIRVLWHGGIALMSQQQEGDKFRHLVKLYRDGVLSGIDSVKPGMPELLKSLGIESNFLMNHVNSTETIFYGSKEKSEKTKEAKVVGIFASSSAWWKNSWNQYFALRMRDDVQGVVIYENKEIEGIFNWNRKPPSHLGYIADSHHFSRQLSKLDLLLYVTFVECSPMLPLEAMSLGVVVICGPSTEYIVGSKLEKYILVKNPDSPAEILEKMQFALDNLTLIRELQFEFIAEYTTKAKQHNGRVIYEIVGNND
jgi:glycosyltransferase involved in cell wall biosynthesis